MHNITVPRILSITHVEIITKTNPFCLEKTITFTEHLTLYRTAKHKTLPHFHIYIYIRFASVRMKNVWKRVHVSRVGSDWCRGARGVRGRRRAGDPHSTPAPGTLLFFSFLITLVFRLRTEKRYRDIAFRFKLSTCRNAIRSLINFAYKYD